MARDQTTAGHASVIALSAMRIGIGLMAWIRPAATAKLFGMRGTPQAESPYLWRLFAIRDVVVGTPHCARPVPNAGHGSRSESSAMPRTAPLR